MKQVFKFCESILLTCIFIFTSCQKNDPVDPVYRYPSIPSSPTQPQQPQAPQSLQPLSPFPPVQDSLSGSEFLYNNLTWIDWGNSVVALEIPDSHLFLNRGIEVSIDSISNWVNVPFYTVEFGMGAPFPYPVNNGYVFDNNYFDNVFLFAIAANRSQLIGATVSVKVKIL